jgi:ABC-type transporter Mla subunit MlaD
MNDTFHFEVAATGLDPQGKIPVERQILEQVRLLEEAVAKLAQVRSSRADLLLEERNRLAAENRRLRETHQIMLGYLDELEKLLAHQGPVRQRLLDDAQ